MRAGVGGGDGALGFRFHQTDTRPRSREEEKRSRRRVRAPLDPSRVPAPAQVEINVRSLQCTIHCPPIAHRKLHPHTSAHCPLIAHCSLSPVHLSTHHHIPSQPISLPGGRVSCHCRCLSTQLRRGDTTNRTAIAARSTTHRQRSSLITPCTTSPPLRRTVHDGLTTHLHN